MSNSPATLRDVAEKAGVGTTTVARVLSGNGYVSEETRTRVEAAVAATGYRVNSLARTLKANRSFILGHLVRSTLPNPFYMLVARGVEEYAQKHGYTALTYNVNTDAMAERKAIETFLSWRADGIIFTTAVSAENVEFAALRRLPLVQVERPKTTTTDRITVHNYDAALAAVRHLTDLGHRRIAYIGTAAEAAAGPQWLSEYVERERIGAYADAMAAVGASTAGLMHFGESYTVDALTAQGHGYDATVRLLAGPVRPTAIFASNDLLAAGAFQAIYEAGLRIPDDISVIGCDDTLAGYLSPQLSSVRLPARDLGRVAAKCVIDTIEGRGGDAPQVLSLDAEFILRNSTGPVRN